MQLLIQGRRSPPRKASAPWRYRIGSGPIHRRSLDSRAFLKLTAAITAASNSLRAAATGIVTGTSDKFANRSRKALRCCIHDAQF
jgi:hypothetical protein